GRRAREDDDGPSVRFEHEAGRGAGEAEGDRTLRQRRLLRHAPREVRVRAVKALRDGARDALDLGLELRADRELHARGGRHELGGPVVVCWPEPARDRAELGLHPLRDSRRELVRRVADDRDPCRLEAEREELLREKRTVQIRSLAADELAACDDDRGPRPPQQLPGPAGSTCFVTISTHGFAPPTCSGRPFSVRRRCSGVPMLSQSRFAVKSWRSPRSSVPWKTARPEPEPSRTWRNELPPFAPPFAWTTRCDVFGSVRFARVFAGGVAVCDGDAPPPNRQAAMMSAATTPMPTTAIRMTLRSSRRSRFGRTSLRRTRPALSSSRSTRKRELYSSTKR